MKYDLTAITLQLQSLSVTQSRKLDAILSDLANHLHNIGEDVSSLQKKISIYSSGQKQKTFNELMGLQEQLDQTGKLLDEMKDYDSHYIDRATNMFGYMCENVREWMEILNDNKKAPPKAGLRYLRLIALL